MCKLIEIIRGNQNGIYNNVGSIVVWLLLDCAIFNK